jgi:hypothetical protein
MSRIVSIEDSKRKNKRYRVYLDDGSYYDFGLRGGNTYIDHHDKRKRENYRKRHLGNETEKHLIEHLIPSPSLYAYYLLWGGSTDLMTNINILNRLLDD